MKKKPSHYRGHSIIYQNGVWCYSDSNVAVCDTPERACGHCGQANNEEGHDGCLGTLPGVANACCGHGNNKEAYVQFESGKHLAGDDALRIFEVHGVGPRVACRGGNNAV